MASTLLIVPELVGEPSLLREAPAGIRFLAERSECGVLAPLPLDNCFELGCFGQEAAQVPDGPLAVAALGYDPPHGSVHYRVTPMSLTGEGILRQIGHRIPQTQLEEVRNLSKVLDTRRLTLLWGEGDLQAMVVEDGSPDGFTCEPGHADGKPFKDCLPLGDEESVLRRFIDDSANILLDAEFNQRRLDDGLPAISLLWPWGGGFRPICTNLSLRFGPIPVVTGSVRMAGAARLCGFRPSGLNWFGTGLNLSLGGIADSLSNEFGIAYLDSFAGLREGHKLDESAWLLSEIDHKLVKPLTKKAIEVGGKLSIASPSSGDGLWMIFDSSRSEGSGPPFDERAFDSTSQNRRTMSNIFFQTFGGAAQDA